MKKTSLRIFLLAMVSAGLTQCMTPATIQPIYATRAVGVVDGEVAFMPASYAGSGGDASSLGAVRLSSRVDDYFSKAFKSELEAFGLRVNAGARLSIESRILKAETLWSKQGPDGVFSTEVEIQFTVRDRVKNDAVVYTQVHSGAASHSQSYGGYPASGSVVDALAQAYTRLLSDPAFYSLLVKGYGYAVAKAPSSDGSQTKVGDALTLEQADLEAFPILMKYYDDHPVGKITLKNSGGAPLTNVELSFFAKEFMDNPKPCGSLETLDDVSSVDLLALFNSSILSVTEGTKVSSVIHAAYTAGGERFSQDFTVTLRVYGRNAMTWDDDRKAAAFVTAKDPTVLRFARNVIGLRSELPAGNLSGSLQRAIILHEAVALTGIRYEVVPASVFKTRKDSRAIDYLQFPKQTLEYRAGNCSDLTVLYAALLESVGVDTAFITVPGHIFMAFAIDTDKESVPQAADFPDAFIRLAGRTWVPVETTMVNDTFARAWQEAAREWADGTREGKAAFYPVREAWQSFEPVDFNEEASPVTAPETSRLVERCTLSVEQVTAWQIASPEAKLKAALSLAAADPVKANRLAVLYARFGKYRQAIGVLEKIAATSSYVPALINLGTASFMIKDYDKAREYGLRAARLQPKNPFVLALLSRTCFEQGDFKESADWYTTLKTLDTALAEKYAYLEGGKETRAAERAETAAWVEE